MSSRVTQLIIIEAFRKWSDLGLKLQSTFLGMTLPSVHFIGSLDEINAQIECYMYRLVGMFSEIA
jgi:hypothetical protein